MLNLKDALKQRMKALNLHKSNPVIRNYNSMVLLNLAKIFNHYMLILHCKAMQN